MSIVIKDDGLIIPEVGAWGKEKYRLVTLYADMFASSMKDKWECRVYLDLFSGAGLSRIEGTREIVAASPLLALDIENRFDRYIFCEENREKFSALKDRCGKFFPTADIRFVEGDANIVVDQIIKEMPQYKKGFRVLSFCFVDPYKVSNLNFETIKKLSKNFMDFLVLIPTHMDAHRNVGPYLQPGNKKVDNFLGSSGWRDEWSIAEKRGERFSNFFADCFGNSMSRLGFIYSGIAETVLIRSVDKNLPLYRLAFFSKNQLAYKLWKEAKKYGNDQLQLL